MHVYGDSASPNNTSSTNLQAFGCTVSGMMSPVFAHLRAKTSTTTVWPGRPLLRHARNALTLLFITCVICSLRFDNALLEKRADAIRVQVQESGAEGRRLCVGTADEQAPQKTCSSSRHSNLASIRLKFTSSWLLLPTRGFASRVS
jgi:hypothetical protein